MKVIAQLAEYSVKYCKRKTTVRRSGYSITFDPKKLCGLCDFNVKTIFIAANLQADNLLTTLLHEYMHALFFELDRDTLAYDEALVETLSQNLARLVRTLPKET